MEVFPPLLLQEGRPPCRSVPSSTPAMQDVRAAGLCQQTVDDFAAHLHRKDSRSVQPDSMLRSFSVIMLGSPSAEEGDACGEESAEAFVRRCKIKGGLRHLHHYRASLKRLLRMLRDRGELAAPSAPPPTVIDTAIQKFATHLRETCGLAQSTMRSHLHYVRCFLQRQYGDGPLQLHGLCRSDLVDFVAQGAKRWTPACVPGDCVGPPTVLPFSPVTGNLRSAIGRGRSHDPTMETGNASPHA